MRLDQAARYVGLESRDELTDEHVRYLPSHLAQIVADEYAPDVLMGADLPLPAFGSLWSSLVTGGSAALNRLDPDRWTTIGYEALLTEPRRELARLADFAGADPYPPWLEESSARIDPSRAGSASRLPASVLSALRAACEPGTLAISRDSSRRTAQ
ncbi:hypothetical protein [Actinomadura sp. BRA 177]|uniref:hypothetical protein n=1 Tax=Actinomadura sp. BRA 177 TaxID=2745202 RepID=UPI0015958538|nr:hypothetical protein [Actinomadura sp. BRA 177]NVI87001.1 hypothetical protein [Actinomadura sp. BRA 177]